MLVIWQAKLIIIRSHHLPAPKRYLTLCRTILTRAADLCLAGNRREAKYDCILR